MDSNLTNIQEYYDKVGHKYDIDFEHFKRICNTPFKFIKEVMSSGILKNIRLQYFGTFQVSKSRVFYSKKVLEKNFNEGKISKERYEKKLKVLNSYEDS